ncbi:MAG: 4Fe-4S dicluster domain-containing protein [Alphaproteobacteria bacterium]|nr:4Fe-4S dicluster domain-containing protein [Alphaproteobacteria bacterium]
MSQKNFLIDVDKCTGCNLCVVACKDEHVDSSYTPWTKPQPEGGQFWMNVKPVERGTIPRVRMNFLPTMCQHCEDAPCISSCPEEAIKTREDGLVWIDAELCTGCGDCQPACPYDVIYKNDDLNIAQKCTGCAHRVDEGDLPRCVDVCPHEAISFGDDLDTAELLHPEFDAKPRVYWKGLPKPWVTGMVVDSNKDEVVIRATVTATDLKDGTSINTSSDEFGEFWLKDLTPDHEYRIEICHAVFENYSDTVTTTSDCELGTIALRTKSNR